MLGRPTTNIDFPWYARRFIRNVAQNATRTLVQGAREARNPIDSAPLFVADTRPAMFFGIPSVTASIFLVIFGESMIFLGFLYAFWVVIPWYGLAIAVRKDYNMPRILALWFQSKAVAFETFRWWGASPTAFPLRGKYPRGIWR
jgi:type IV secretion system protein VirB3